MDKQLCTSNKTVRVTPQWLFDKLDKEFNFDLDSCASKENSKCRNYISEKDNTLNADWKKILYNKTKIDFRNLSVFMNPPYGRQIGKFIKKAYEESLKGCIVVCLLPVRTDTRWWFDYCIKALEIRFLMGKLKSSDSKNCAPFPRAIVIFDEAKKYFINPIISWVDYKEIKLDK